MSYEPPVSLYDFVNETSKKLAEERDEYIYKRISTYVDVDKEELIKALRYDRDQYNKGYEDGLKDAIPVAHGHWENNNGYISCSECGNNGIETDYCPHCGAKMDENGGEQE